VARKTRPAEPELVRFGVSMEPELLERFDRLLGEAGDSCRSKAVRDMVRARLAEADLASGRANAVGVLSYVYSHGQRELAQRLLRDEHEHHAEVVTTVHIHLDHRSCFEVVLLRGRADRLRALAGQLTSTRGVRHARFSLSPATCPLAHKNHNH